MTGQDLRRLGKISIKSRKKSTKNTVRGIVFGLVMIIPVIFFIFSFYIDLTGKMNDIRTLSSFTFDSKHFINSDDTPLKRDNTTNQPGIMSYAMAEKYTNNRYVEDRVSAMVLRLPISSQGSSKYSLGGDYKSFPQWPESNGDYRELRVNSNLSIINTKDSGGNVATSGEMEDYKKQYGKESIYKYGSGFTPNGDVCGKGEIVVSELFAKYLGEDAAQLVGKSLSMSTYVYSYLDYYVVDNDTVVGNGINIEDNPNVNISVEFIKDFKIVGIVDTDFYRLVSRRDDSHIWLTDGSMFYGDESQSLFPKLTKEVLSEENGQDNTIVIATYGKTLNELSEYAAEEKLFLPIIGEMSCVYESYGSGLDYYTLRTIAQTKSFNDASKLDKIVTKDLEELFGQFSYEAQKHQNELFTNFNMMNTIGGYIIMIFAVFGGIIFIATMLNLYNSINYSVQSRRNYIGVMRAIGAKQKLIPKMYFVEIVLIFLRAMVWTLIFSFGLVFLIKWGMDTAFSYAAEMMSIELTLSLWYYPITLVVVVAVIFLIAFAFSRIACKNVANQGILEVLSDDK